MNHARHALGDRHRVERSRETVRRLLNEVAPDLDLDDLDPAELLNDTVGLDSLDFVRLMELIGEESGVEISALDDPTMASIDGLVAHLEAHRVPEAADRRTCVPWAISWAGRPLWSNASTLRRG